MDVFFGELPVYSPFGLIGVFGYSGGLVESDTVDSGTG